MQQDELKKFLTDFAAERLALLQRHEAAARVVGHYDFNNTYQYVIAREETHLSWLQSALAELGVTAAAVHVAAARTRGAKAAKKSEAAAYRDILAADAKFLERVRRALARARGRPSRTHGIARCSTWCSASRSSINGCSTRPPRASRTCSAAAPAASRASARVLPDRWQE